MKIVSLVPDRISKPFSGLGSSFKEIHARLKDKIDFYVVGHSDYDSGIENYRTAETLMSFNHPGVARLVGQSTYIREAMLFNVVPDLVYAHDYTVYQAAAELATIWNVPLVVNFQESSKMLSQVQKHFAYNIDSPDGMHLQNAQFLLEEDGLRRATHIIAVSNALANIYTQHKHKTSIIPHGVSFSIWENVETVKLPGDREKKAIFMGRLDFVKGLQFLLKTQFPENMDLILYGDPAATSDEIIRSILKHPALAERGYHIRPRVYGKEKLSILKSADLMIMPSLHEPFGITALEALASQTVLLSSRVGGMDDFLNDENSILADPSEEGITQALNHYNSLDDDAIGNLIESGLSTCLDYNWNNIAIQYYDLFKAVCSK